LTVLCRSGRLAFVIAPRWRVPPAERAAESARQARGASLVLVYALLELLRIAPREQEHSHADSDRCDGKRWDYDERPHAGAVPRPEDPLPPVPPRQPSSSRKPRAPARRDDEFEAVLVPFGVKVTRELPCRLNEVGEQLLFFVPAEWRFASRITRRHSLSASTPCRIKWPCSRRGGSSSHQILENRRRARRRRVFTPCFSVARLQRRCSGPV
jgi:hypothetical protein